jgi:hypothetical protein
MLCVIRPKGCKRCGGDVSLECDIYGVYAQCIQCGASWEKKEVTQPRLRELLERQAAAKVAAGRR